MPIDSHTKRAPHAGAPTPQWPPTTSTVPPAPAPAETTTLPVAKVDTAAAQFERGEEKLHNEAVRDLLVFARVSEFAERVGIGLGWLVEKAHAAQGYMADRFVALTPDVQGKFVSAGVEIVRLNKVTEEVGHKTLESIVNTATVVLGDVACAVINSGALQKHIEARLGMERDRLLQKQQEELRAHARAEADRAVCMREMDVRMKEVEVSLKRAETELIREKRHQR